MSRPGGGALLAMESRTAEQDKEMRDVVAESKRLDDSLAARTVLDPRAHAH